MYSDFFEDPIKFCQVSLPVSPMQSRESHSVDALRAYSDDVSVLTQLGESSGLCSYCESKHL